MGMHLPPDVLAKLNLPPLKKARGRHARHVPGQMNKTEESYAQHLQARQLAGEVLRWWFEPLKLRLADRCFFTPDFLVMDRDGFLELHEVKGGFIEEDSKIKLKVAAEQYPLFRFFLCQKKNAKTPWKIEEV